MPPIRQLRELRPATMRASTSRFQSLAPHGPLAPLAEPPIASRPNALRSSLAHINSYNKLRSEGITDVTIHSWRRGRR